MKPTTATLTEQAFAAGLLSRYCQLPTLIGVSDTDFCRACGLRGTVLSELRAGRARVTMGAIAGALSAFPSISAEWLLRGYGVPFISTTPTGGDTPTDTTATAPSPIMRMLLNQSSQLTQIIDLLKKK